MTITLDNSILDAIIFDESIQEAVPSNNYPYFNRKSGLDHYRLLSYLASQVNGKTLIDIGTNSGGSALALSTNKTNKVISYDVYTDIGVVSLQSISNIELRIKDCREDKDDLINSPIIMLDTTHDGIHEKLVYDFLVTGGFSGLLVMDDINYFSGLTNFWNTIQTKKLDITKYGHVTGTGLVVFNDTEIILQ